MTKMAMDKGKYIGWGTGKNDGKPFSKKEYDKSHIKTGFKKSYAGYLQDYARIKAKRTTRTVKRVASIKPRIQSYNQKWSSMFG
jgi:hypothetical protein